MSDTPTLFTEVLRRAEERRAALAAAIEQHKQNIMTYEARLGEERTALVGLQRELATLEHIIEPLSDEAVAWCNTEKAQPWARPEQHRRTRRNLSSLVLDAVRAKPGQRHVDIAGMIYGRPPRRITTRIGEVLEAIKDAGKIEWRDGWYPVPELEIVSDEDVPGASGMSVLIDPDEPAIWDQEAADAMEPSCEAHTAPSTDTPAEILPTPETAPSALAETPRHTPEWTLDFIRRAGAGGLGDFQLRNHVYNLSVLEKLGAIERGVDGRYRHVVSGPEVEAAK